MVAEGIVALIWAAAVIAFTGGYERLAEYFATHTGGAGTLVTDISMTWLRSHRRYTGNHRRCGRTYNFRRHRTAVRTPYRRRHAAYRTGKSMETPANIHPYFCSGISFAANRLHRAMVLFRMEQSDTCRVHPMGPQQSIWHVTAKHI